MIPKKLFENFLKLFAFVVFVHIFVSMKQVKQHRSKYNFGNLKEVGESMYVEPEDVYSALQSLNSFNRRHGKNIVLTPEGESDDRGRIKLVVTSI